MQVSLIELSERRLVAPITCFISPANPVSSASIGEQGQWEENQPVEISDCIISFKNL